MKSKLQTSIGELYKLKNQIRVQLNQIRTKNPPPHVEKNVKSAKKLFVKQRNNPTDIVNPSAEKSKALRQKSKRMFDRQNIVNTSTSRIVEKKHYGRHYADNVTLQNNVRHKTSPYLNIKPSKEAQQERSHNTSLSGIGMHDKSLTEINTSRKRIYQDKLVYKPNFF